MKTLETFVRTITILLGLPVCCLLATAPARAETCPPGMVLVPAGTFTMGCTRDTGCWSNEVPAREVTISKSFCMDATEATNADWADCMAAGDCAELSDDTCIPDGMDALPEFFKTPDRPVVCADHTAAAMFCTAAGKRLPTEAQWEFAARAGARTMFYWGDEMDDDYAWHWDNAVSEPGAATGTMPVGTKKPNALGLYDMAGNAAEWTRDCFDEMWYHNRPDTDPENIAADCEMFTTRGGSWGISSLRHAARAAESASANSPYIGFRCVADPLPGTSEPPPVETTETTPPETHAPLPDSDFTDLAKLGSAYCDMIVAGDQAGLVSLIPEELTEMLMKVGGFSSVDQLVQEMQRAESENPVEACDVTGTGETACGRDLLNKLKPLEITPQKCGQVKLNVKRKDRDLEENIMKVIMIRGSWKLAQ